jgi:hypothetical protein
MPGKNGPSQPPKNNKVVNAAIAKVLIYSARKKTAQ